MIRTVLAVPALLLAHPAAALEVPPAAGAEQPAKSPYILLEGGRNFRDVGGYRTADGHVVKAQTLYRSGSLGGLTAAGQADLAALHIASVIDLRTNEERARDAFDVKAAYGTRYWARDYAIAFGDLRALFSDASKLSGESMQAMMIAGYRGTPKEQAASYRALFASLLATDGPVLVNCTAGKDRTGVATALVLTALGVPYETVREDYLLSNGAPGMKTMTGVAPAGFPPEVLALLGTVQPAYLDAAFAQITQDYGSVEGYLDKELGMGPDQIAQLRKKMLA